MDGGLQLCSPWSSSRCKPAVASFHHNQILAPRPSPLAKLIKTPIRVNPLAFSLCGAYRSSTADGLGYMNRRNYSELITEWVTHFTHFTQAPENNIRVISNFFENSRRYSQFKVHKRCQRHRWQICRRCQRRRGQIATGINNTGSKFATGVIDTGGK